MSGAAYAVRVLVLRELGLDAAGLYQAAWTLGGLYVGFVLQAMGADFYPRLVRSVHDRPLCNRLVNEQLSASLLLAGPGVLATLALAPWMLVLLYSQQFDAAGPALRWICLGMALRTITWPMGFIIVAQGRQTLFFLTELAWALVNVTATWYCVQRFGLEGAGIAFFLSYLMHGAMLFPIVRRLSGFNWTRNNLASAAWTLVLCAAAMVGTEVLSSGWALVAGLAVAFASAAWSFRTLAALVPAGRLPKVFRRRASPA